MKPLLGWLKSNFVIVILGILAVVPPTVAFFVAGGMNKSLVENRQKDASSALTQLRGSTVRYTLPPLTPDEEPVELSTAPNAAITEAFRAERERREAQLERVKQAAIEFNRQGRGALVEGLFPEPSPGESQLKRNEMARRAVASGTPESAYSRLFDRLRIRPTTDGGALGEQLAAQRDGQIAQITGDQGEQALSPEQKQQLDTQMWAYRLGQYRAHAQDTVFYGDASVLPASVPTAVAPVPPPLEQCFAWQFDYWLIEDVLTALAQANAALDDTGVGGNVLSGVVKRVERLSIDPAPYEAAQPTGGNRRGDDESSGVRTLTGRSQGSSDAYDLRFANTTLIVASAKLPVLLDAIASSNFMTVIDLDIAEIDPWRDLEQGYFYGSDALVRVDLRIEAVYLRSWTAGFMPPVIREVLGVPDPMGDESGEG